MENPVIFMTLLLIIGFYDDIERFLIRLAKTFRNKKVLKGS